MRPQTSRVCFALFLPVLMLLSGCGDEGSSGQARKPQEQFVQPGPVAQETPENPQPVPPPREVPEVNANQLREEIPQTLDEVLAILQTNDSLKKVRATGVIARMPVEESKRQEVARILMSAMSDSNPTVRKNASIALRAWATPEVIPSLARLVRSGSDQQRRSSLVILSKMKVPEAVRPIVGALGTPFDRSYAESALMEMGPIVEEDVVNQIMHSDSGVRLAVCRILAEHGSAFSIDALEMASEDPDSRVATAAQKALLAIEGG